MAAEKRPILGITMGDAAGIGPEVLAKSLAVKEISDISRPFIIGSSYAMSEAVKLIKKRIKIREISKASEAKGEFRTIDVMDLHNLDPKDITVGKISAACGRASMEYIQKAMELCLSKEIQAMVTAPINKEATMLAGYEGLGHLEYLAKATKAPVYATMLAVGNLRCVHLTTHYSLRDACDHVKKGPIVNYLKLTDHDFQKWGFGKPRIGVAALNPHAGEDGMFGREEIDEITPAVKEAVSQGINATGPLPADSIFNHAINGRFDVILVMYHDQGHIPVKVHGFEKSVSVALGLPFLRTAVDHGTAFDIAGKGIANAESMGEAMKVAVDLIEGRGLKG